MEEMRDFAVKFLHYQEVYYVRKWRRWLLNFSIPTEVQYTIYQRAPPASTNKESVFSIRNVYMFHNHIPACTACLNKQRICILHTKCVYVSYDSRHSDYIPEQEQLIFNGDGLYFMRNKSKFVKYTLLK